jgi:hypothetical protein
MSAGAELALHADMLVRLEEGGALTRTGLDLSSRSNMTYEQYEAIGTLLGRASAAIRWAVGDWLAFGEDRFGEPAAQAAEALGISPEGRMELVRVARAIPRHRRRPLALVDASPGRRQALDHPSAARGTPRSRGGGGLERPRDRGRGAATL